MEDKELLKELPEIKQLAEIEARNLRKHLTDEEKDRLNIDTINPHNPLNCIYGQATRDCRSVRAYDLIRICCTKVLKSPRELSSYPLTKSKINGEPKELDSPSDRLAYYVSPIEVLIYRVPSTIPLIVNYLKGVTDEINLTT